MIKKYFIKILNNKYFPYLLFLAITLLIFYKIFLPNYTYYGDKDIIEQTIPNVCYNYRAVKNHEIPQWNPYIFCGTSGLSNAYNNFFYPAMWIIYLFPEKFIPFIYGLLLLVHFYLLFVFSYLFFVNLFKNKFISIMSTLIYALSSSIIYNLRGGICDTLSYAILPLLFYLAYTYKKRNIFLNIILNTLTISILFLGGSPQAILYIILFYVTFTLYLLIKRLNKKIYFNKPVIIIAFVSLMLGIMAGSVRIMTLKHPNTPYQSSKLSIEEGNKYIFDYHIYPIELINIFSPRSLGFEDDYLGKQQYYDSIICYVGVIGVYTALFAFFFIWNRKTLYWKIMVVLIILTDLGTPITLLHYFVTGNTTIYYTRITFLLPFCLSALFGYGFFRIINNIKSFKDYMTFSIILFILTVLVLMNSYRYLPESMNKSMLTNMINSNLSFSLFSGITFIALFFLYFFHNRDYIIKYLFFAVLLLDLYVMNLSGLNLFENAPLYQVTDDINIIKNEMHDKDNMFRYFDSVSGKRYDPNNINIVHNYFTSYGYDNFIPLRITRHIRFLFGGVFETRESRLLVESLRTNQLTSTLTYVENGDFRTDIHEKADYYPRVKLADTEDGPFYKTPDCLPRLKLFNNYEIFSDEDSELARLYDPDFDFQEFVILNREPQYKTTQGNPKGGVKFLSQKFNSMEIEVDALNNTVLLINDAFEEGWTAVMDGKECEILRANFAFRGISVPAGYHIINLEYIHRGIKKGLTLTLTAVSILILLIFIYLIYKFLFPLIKRIKK
ncbi:MAG: YfhO family protein [Spirochaetes bacterium]|nr:YfhO family protein [Spirochaetota bacterium]